MDETMSCAGYPPAMYYPTTSNINGSVYPSGSKSASASPGPIQRFRQKNGYGQELPRANFSPNQTQNQYTARWMEDYQYSSAGANPGGSRPGSVMSSFSTCSIATNMSQLTIMTDDTEMTATSFMPIQMQPQNLVTGDDIRQMTLNLIEQLKFGAADLDQTLVNIRGLAKSRSFTYLEEGVVFNLMDALFYRLKVLADAQLPDVQSSSISHTFSAIHNVIYASKESTEIFLKYGNNNCGLSKFLCHFLDVSKTYTRFVLFIVSTLISSRKESTQYHIKNVRNFPDMVKTLIACIHSKSKTLVRTSLIMLPILIRDFKLKMQFYQQHGLEVLLNILNTENEEKLLYSTANVLSTLISHAYENSKQLFVDFFKFGGIHICAKHLDHGSVRLLQSLMKCLTNVADIKELVFRTDLKEPMQKVFKLLGSLDIDVVIHAIGFLGNVVTDNNQNKLYLVQINAPIMFFRVMSEVQVKMRGYVYKQNEFEKLEKLIDHSLWAIILLMAYTMPDEVLKNQAANAAINQICQYSNWQVQILDVIEAQHVDNKSYAANLLNLMFHHQPSRLLEFEKPRSTIGGVNINRVIYNAIDQVIKFPGTCESPFHPLLELTPDQRSRKLITLLVRLLSILNMLVESQMFCRSMIAKISSTNYWILSLNYQNVDSRVHSELQRLAEKIYNLDPVFRKLCNYPKQC